MSGQTRSMELSEGCRLHARWVEDHFVLKICRDRAQVEPDIELTPDQVLDLMREAEHPTLTHRISILETRVEGRYVWGRWAEFMTTMRGARGYDPWVSVPEKLG